MKTLIISDSHGLTEEVEVIKNRHQKDVDAMIHCGDSELQQESPVMDNFIGVRGNCDYDPGYPDAIVEEIAGTRFLVTHGHLYNIKMSLMNLSYKAEEEDASIICFGHSHHAGSELIDGRLYINPGSIRLPRGRKEKTYVIVEVADKEAAVTFYDHKGAEVKDLNRTYILG